MPQPPSANNDERPPGPGSKEQPSTARAASGSAVGRVRHQARWVDLQIQQAMERGDFDDLPGQGKPLGDLGSPYDRDWWLRKLIEREQVTGVLPEALQLRSEDAALDAELDRESVEKRVRELLDAFNRRIVEARRQLQGGPPVVTALREVEAEVALWRQRRTVRLARPDALPVEREPRRRRLPWFGPRRPGTAWSAGATPCGEESRPASP